MQSSCNVLSRISSFQQKFVRPAKTPDNIMTHTPEQKWKCQSLRGLQLFATPWTVVCQAPRSVGFSRQKYWSGLLFSSPGDFPDPGIELESPTLQADFLPSEPLGKETRTKADNKNLWEQPGVGFSRQRPSSYHYSEVKSLSRVRPFVTPWTITYQALLSMGFSRQEYWSGLPFPSPGVFQTQQSNSGLQHCRQMLYCLSHQGSQAVTIINTFKGLMETMIR